MRIPVVLSTDAGYAVPTYVTVFSLLSSAAPSTAYDISVLVPERLPAEIERRFTDLLEAHPACRLTFLPMAGAFSEVATSFSHISFVTYYRFLIPEVLTGESRCIYLDTDIVVRHDLSELYATDLEGCVAAGVKNPLLEERDPEIYRARCERLGIPDLKSYVNAGVLLLDLDALRASGLAESMKALVGHNDFPYDDQDVFNVVLHGKIKTLPLRYNAMTCYLYERRQDLVRPLFGAAEFAEAEYDATVIHYVSHLKPWKSRYIFGVREWYRVLSRIDPAVRRETVKPFLKKMRYPALRNFKEAVKLCLKWLCGRREKQMKAQKRGLFGKLATLKKCVRVLWKKAMHRGFITPTRQMIDKGFSLELKNGGKVILSERFFARRDLSLIADGGSITVGRDVFMNRNVSVTSLARVEIADGVTIANNVVIVDHDHSADGGFVAAPVKIGRGAWIGANAVILKGVTVGEGAVIAAGAIVNTDVPPHSVYINKNKILPRK